MSTNGAPAYRFNGGDESVMIAGYDADDARSSLAQQLQKQVEPTPDPGTESEDDGHGTGGVIRRSNEFRSRLGPTMLESIALAGMELSKSIERRARDLYRNKFPLLQPRFAKVCRHCEIKFDDEEIDVCPECGDDLETPDEQQRAEAKEFFRRVNKEGQSLSELYQELGKDGGRLGGWAHIVRYNYGVLAGGVLQEPVELVRADPKRLKPVVDEDGRIGGYWWTCPIHRAAAKSREPGTCDECGADLREVFFAETDGPRDDDVEKLYFEDEVIDFAAFNERLAGHDWVSPVVTLWKRQAILEWMNSYAAAFFDDQNNDRFPGRLMILHTTNRNAVEKQLKEAQDERDQDPYANGVLYNEIPRDGGGSGDAQVVDLMNDELLGQSPDLKDDFKSDIRSVYGQVDVQDSELEDAGGLNNEGLQLSVRDDAIASWHQSLKDGPLDKLMRVMGWDDWKIAFVPPDGPEEDPDPTEVVQAAATAEQAGIAYAIEDGSFRLADTEGVKEPERAPDAAPGEDDDGGGPAPDEAPASFARDSERDIDIPLAKQAVRSAVETLDRDDAVKGAEWIGDTYDEMFTPADEQGTAEQQAVTPTGNRVRSPEFASEKDVPEFAEELLDDAIKGGAIEKPEELSQGELPLLEAVVRRNLVTEGRWTIKSVADDIHQTVNADEAQARVYAVNAVQNVVQSAIQLGYMVGGNLDERRFYFGGPKHPNICDICETLLNETNPGYGGEPVELDKLNGRIEEVATNNGVEEQFVNIGTPHPNCIHRVVEHRGSRS